MSASAVPPGARCSRSWVVRLCSQDSRSGPVIRITPRCERSTTPARRERALLGERVAVVGGDAGVRPVRPRRLARRVAGCP